MNLIVDPNFHMWFVLALTAITVFFFIREDFPLEITSIALLTLLLLLGQLLPLRDVNGQNLLDSAALLAGFANPSLMAVLALLVMGQAMIHTDALRMVTDVFAVANKRSAWLAIISVLIFVMVVSAFLNNTPLVIIAIPLIQALGHSIGLSESRVMIPLSFAAILGGMTTLIGSSTNLLVASSMTELGYESLRFFDFVVPGSILATVGFFYIILILPRMLPDRSSMAHQLKGGEKEFVAELDVTPDSKLIGMECEEGRFPDLENLSIKLIQRGGHLILPPFEGYKIESGDILIIAATRDTLTDLLSKFPGFLLSEQEEELIEQNTSDEDDPPSEVKAREARVLAEIMITPASRISDMSLDQIGLEKRYGAIVLGIQRRARVVRRRLGRIRLEAGDVLLVAGRRSAVDALRGNADFIVLSGSKRELPMPGKARIALGVFFATIASAAVGILTIPVAAITGAVLMIATGCLNIRQATRAIDRKIFIMVAAMLGLGVALQVTGGAGFIAGLMMSLPFSDTPLGMAAVLFITVAFFTNILTNNACAILFTPIAMNMAGNIEVHSGINADIAFIFAVTVIFGANCSFASPIGYQTNLLVMGPGHYRFRDFIKSGVPLVGLLWVTYILVAKYYFGL